MLQIGYLMLVITGVFKLISSYIAYPLNQLYYSLLAMSSLTLLRGFCSIQNQLVLNILFIYYNYNNTYYQQLKMFQIFFEDVTFAQPSKYVIIIKTLSETKRSEVCTLWTSVPTFSEPIILQTLDNVVVKACSATIDRKLTVIGSFKIEQQQLDLENKIILEANKNFYQTLEEQEVCIGNCKIRIIRKLEQAENKQLKEIDDEYQLKSEQESQEDNDQLYPKCQLKLIIHGGFDFYLNSGFRVCVNWGRKRGQTNFVKNRINPFWGKTINLQGRQNQFVELIVEDIKGSKLQWVKIDPQQIRIMYPYHLHVQFREQYVGLHPHFYMTIIREDVPLFSILDKKINIRIKYIGPVAPQKAQQYVLIYPRDLQENQMNRLPIFIDLNMKNYISFETINKMIEMNPEKKYQWTNWNLLVPVNVFPDDNTKDFVSLLKSFLTKSLVCIYFVIDDAKSLFCHQLWNNVTMIDRKQSFQNNIKELYYNQKRIFMGKAVQFSNMDVDGLENEKSAVSLQQKWKILTHNYGLRKQLLTKSIQTTESTKKQIKQKGQYLQHLKKVLLEVKKMNDIMIQKQKSAIVPDNKVSKKIRDNYMQYKTMQIITFLIQKQVQLEKRKKINDEMRMRMDSLHYFNEDSQHLDKAIVQNANKLLEQQQKIKQIHKIRQALPKQRQVIHKLQKMFQKRQIDKQMNQLLKKQQNKLNQMKKAGSKNLEKVYNIVKEHKSSPNSLLQSIKAAEQQLIKLNSQFAKLTT